jgi:hypothetical protein
VKYRVLLKAVYNVYHEVEAESVEAALDAAEKLQLTDPPSVPYEEFGGEIVAALVDTLDEAGEVDYDQDSPLFLASHHYLPEPEGTPEWKRVP